MYQYLQGVLQEAANGIAVVDVHGVGYLLYVSEKTIGALNAPGAGAEVKLYTYLNVREDALELFGFRNEEEKRAFLLLIGVSGVGPRAALSILSALSPDALQTSVLHGDVSSISAANGVGAKTAQKVILELKDKLVKEPLFAIKAPASAPADAKSAPESVALNEAIGAMVVLGYPRAHVLRAASELEYEDKGVEELTLALLRKLGGN